MRIGREYIPSNPLLSELFQMKTCIHNGTILTPDFRVENSTLIVEDHKILGIEPGKVQVSGSKMIDAKGQFIVPGMIDIHIHGAKGFDTMDASPEALQEMARYLATHGVTSFLPTTVTASANDIGAAIANVASTYYMIKDGAQILGIHLEGPSISKDYCGAQPKNCIRPADPAEYEIWIESGIVRLITVGPEVEGVIDLIKLGRMKGVEFAVGHSEASYDTVIEAMKLGLLQASHVFNGMPPLHHREPGVLGAVLSEDQIYAQIIADGIHLHPAIIKMLINAKGIGKTILISDAMRATGMPDGKYALGDQQVNVQNGIARTQTGGLAGSTLTLDKALKNTIEFTGLNLQQVLAAATKSPAKSLGLDHRKGIIAPEYDADIVIMDTACATKMTMVGGQVLFNNL